MHPKMDKKHDKKPNGIWNEIWMDFGAILAPFWEPWGAHGLPFGGKKCDLCKDGHQNGAQKLPGTPLLAPWRPKGMPKCPQGPQRPSFLRILVPRRDFFHKNWANDHLFLPPKKCHQTHRKPRKIKMSQGVEISWIPCFEISKFSKHGPYLPEMFFLEGRRQWR